MLHIGIAEGDVAKFHALDFLGERNGIVAIVDIGFEVEELEKIADKEAVVIKSRDACHKVRKIGLSSAEGFEKHDEGTDGDGALRSAGNEEEGDEEECGCFDDGTDGIVKSQTARDMQQVVHQTAANIDKEFAEIRGKAEGAHLFGKITPPKQCGIVACAAIVLRVVATEGIHLA